MSLALAIDPGTRVTGCSLWNTEWKKLLFAGAVKNPIREGSGPRECASMGIEVSSWVGFKELNDRITQLIFEYPQIYARGKGSKSDPNRIMPLAGVDSAIATLFPTAVVTTYKPRDWKNTVEKPDHSSKPYVIEARVLERLDDQEKMCVSWPVDACGKGKVTGVAREQNWDVADSIGVGLHFFGRFERKRVFARE